jgi:hypothetical protein
MITQINMRHANKIKINQPMKSNKRQRQQKPPTVPSNRFALSGLKEARGMGRWVPYWSILSWLPE